MPWTHKFGESAYAHTEHNALLCALVRVHYRASWWEYSYALDCAYCLLCSRPISPKMGVTEAMFAAVVVHERKHVEALGGGEKVAAAEMLYRLRLEEAASTVTGFTLEVSKHYHLGSLVPELTSGDAIPKFDLPTPTMKSIIEEVWGCIPNAVLPPTTTEGP